LRLLREKITPGPWVAEEYRHTSPPHYNVCADCNEDGGAHDGLCWVADLGVERHDTEFIVELHNAASALLDDADALAGALAEVERLRANVAALESEVELLCDEDHRKMLELERLRSATEKARDILDRVERRMIDAGQAAESDEDEDWWGDTVEELQGAIAALAPQPDEKQARNRAESGLYAAQGPESATDAVVPATGRKTGGVER
jgi:hypothetical protein